jgi:hypothetical protein
MQRYGVLLVVALACGLGVGCSGDDVKEPAASASSAAPRCPAAWRAGWQRLADRIDAAVYCPSWLPDPLTGEIDGRWNNIHSVGDDGSYLLGFTWYEVPSGEIHVNLRGYPRTVRIPICDGKLPCFSDRGPTKRLAGTRVTVYTANRGADRWHVLYAWTNGGSLYTLSEHVAPPLSYGQVVRNLDRMFRALELIGPSSPE